MTTHAHSGVGVTMSIDGVLIAEITSLECPTLEAEPIEITPLDTDTGYRTYINGFKDSGEVKIEGNFVTDSAGQRALKDVFESKTLSYFIINFPAEMVSSWDFRGVVVEYSVSVEADEAISFECKIKVSGQTSLNSGVSKGLYNLMIDDFDGNLLTNPQMMDDENSDGVADGWTFTGHANVTVTNSIDATEMAQKIDVTESTGANSIKYSYSVDCNESEVLTFGIYLKRASGTIRYKVDVEFLTENWEYISGDYTGWSNSATYEKVSRTVTAPLTAKRMNIIIQVNPITIGNTGVIYAKMAYVTRVKENLLPVFESTTSGYIAMVNSNVDQVDLQASFDPLVESGKVNNVDITIPTLFTDGTVLDDFDNLASWVGNNANALSAQDTNIKMHKAYTAKFYTDSDGALTTYTKTINLDLSDLDNLLFVFYVADESKTTPGIFTFYLSNDAGFANHYYYSVSPNVVRSGWNYLQVNRDSFSSWGSPSWSSNMTRMQIYIDYAAGQQGEFYFDRIIKNHYERPRLVMMYDDARASVYTKLWSWIQSLNVKVTIPVTSGLVGDSGYMTVGQLQEFYNAGHDIINHSDTHTSFTSLTQEQIEAEIQTCEDFLVANGMTRSAKFLAHPNNAVNATSRLALLAKGIIRARGGPFVGIQQYPIEDPLEMRTSFYPIDTTTKTDCKNFIDELVAKGGVGITYTHDIVDVPTDPYESGTEEMKYLLEYAVLKNVQVCSFSQAMALPHVVTIGEKNTIVEKKIAVKGSSTVAKDYTLTIVRGNT
jgi:peptidoglycan/xylan/chitin deacetylase (PgdA/CDA1 family)/predicted secreted protein